MGLALGYPILPKTLQAEFDSRADRALIHALIRQESEFDRNAVSRSGALGLMQLMPKTAAYVAKKMDVSHSTGALTADPAHNVALGSRYISDRLADFEHPALAIAAYNAGQGRVRQWVKQYGDPRSPNVNWIDWVESIPTYETRNYVQRVLENQNIYAALLSD
jgi:soluble lytic murein transglycosylase